MKVIRTCPFTGVVNEREIDVTLEEIKDYNEGSKLIQNAFPNLSADDREFIKTGITPEQWELTMGNDQ